MSLDHVLASLGLPHRDPNSLEARLESMQREVRRIGRTLSRQAGHTADVVGRQASHAADDWTENLSDLGREAARQGAHLAEVASTQAWRGAKAVRRDPLPAIAVVGTALLLLSFLRR